MVEHGDDTQVPGREAAGGPAPPTAPDEARPAPPTPERPGPVGWAREKLFSTWSDTLLTLAFGAVLVWIVVGAARFVFVTAEWTIIRVNLTNLMVGLFPRGEVWRPWVGLFLIVVVLALSLGMARRVVVEAAAEAAGEETSTRTDWRQALRRTWPILTLLAVLLGFSASAGPTVMIVGLVALAVGAYLAGRRLVPATATRWWVVVALLGVAVFFLVIIGFGGVSWDRWGGLLLTLYFAVGGIILSFPLGIALALGRRSSFPAIRAVCVGYIEVIRGVPLITILFMGNFMLGFFFPGDFSPSKVVRALLAFTLFTAAYVAEVVRGGLQGVPRGQVEAAQAVGLSPFKVTRLIVLPQALRSVIPALVGQFISLFKDTSLAAIIGLTEFLFFAQNITNQPRFVGRGLQAETLTFAAFVYWVFAYTMSKESQRLERRLGVGER